MDSFDRPPAWVKEAVFYQIFPDRFARSQAVAKPANLEPWSSPPTAHGFKGGDLIGIAERLDYLSDLGVNALYLNPIFQSTCNHRYHTHDYFRVDPLLGGDDALRHLLNEAHRRDMRVILDGVFNHASRGFFQFNDILENGPSSPWLDWFIVQEWPLAPYAGDRPANYACWWDNRALPKFNTDNPDVRDFLLRAAGYWIREFDIDGWRLDVPKEIKTPGFWEEFRRRVRNARADAYIVGEIWREAPDWLAGDRFDALMNYPLAAGIIAFCFGERVRPELVEGRAYEPYPPLDAVQFGKRLKRLFNLYSWETILAQFNILGSHDTARLTALAAGDVQSVKLATLLQMTLPGVPCVYYGDEIGLMGGQSAADPFRDEDARRSFPWPDRSQWDGDLLAYFKELIALRRGQQALREGDFRQLAAAGHGYAFARQAGGETIVVAVNPGADPLRLEMPLPGLLKDSSRLTPLLKEKAKFEVDDGRLGVALNPQSGIVLGLTGGD